MSVITTINTIKVLIVVLAVYFPTVTVSGYFAAWVAKKFGDDTAEERNLLSLNPLEHTSLFGLFVLLLSQIFKTPFIVAFGRHVPVVEHQINPPFVKLKYLIALWARAFANLCLSCLAILIWILFFKYIVWPFNLDQRVPAVLDSMQLMFVVFRRINIISFMIEWLYGLVFFIMSFVFPQINEESVIVYLVIEIYLLLLAWYFVTPYMQNYVIELEYWFGNLVGILIG